MKYHVQNYSMCINRMRESYVGLGEIALMATGNAWDSGGLWEGDSGLGRKYLWRRGDSYETDLLDGEGLWERSFRMSWWPREAWGMEGEWSRGYRSFQCTFIFKIVKVMWLYTSFPGGWDSKESAYCVGDMDSIPGSGRSPGEGNSPLSTLQITHSSLLQEMKQFFTLICFQSFYMYQCPLFVPALPLNVYFMYMFHVYYK